MERPQLDRAFQYVYMVINITTFSIFYLVVHLRKDLVHLPLISNPSFLSQLPF